MLQIKMSNCQPQLSSVHYSYCALSFNVFEVWLSLSLSLSLSLGKWMSGCCWRGGWRWSEQAGPARTPHLLNISHSVAPVCAAPCNPSHQHTDTHHVTTSQCLRQAQPWQEKSQIPRRGGIRGSHKGERWRRDHEHVEESQCGHWPGQDQHGRDDGAAPGQSTSSQPQLDRGTWGLFWRWTH